VHNGNNEEGCENACCRFFLLVPLVKRPSLELIGLWQSLMQVCSGIELTVQFVEFLSLTTVLSRTFEITQESTQSRTLIILISCSIPNLFCWVKMSNLTAAFSKNAKFCRDFMEDHPRIFRQKHQQCHPSLSTCINSMHVIVKHVSFNRFPLVTALKRYRITFNHQFSQGNSLHL